MLALTIVHSALRTAVGCLLFAGCFAVFFPVS